MPTSFVQWVNILTRFRMAYMDYYRILGVERTATQEDIKRAYRKQARRFHPDLHPDDPKAQQRFQELNEANEVLGDPEKRKKYDEYGEHWKHADELEEQQRSDRTAHMFTGGSGFSDFFEELFGGRARQAYAFRGQDLQAELQLTLREAATTHKRIIQTSSRKLRITIPAGIADGQRIRLPGKGGEGLNGGKPGDLYITFHLLPDPLFTRQGDDLYATLSIDLYTALLGGEATMETLDGKIRVSIRPGTQNGTRIRIKGKGFPVYKKAGETGDLIVTCNVLLPEHLTERQKALLREMKEG